VSGIGLEGNPATSDAVTTCEDGVSAGGAESGAVGPEIGKVDPALASLVVAWPSLTASVKARILAIIGSRVPAAS